MDWYYARNNKQVGPVSEAELINLFESNEINASTMVWCEQMSDWQAYQVALGQTAEAVSVQTPPSLNVDDSKVWKQGKAVVLERDAELPCRCVKCNREAEGALIAKKLSYYHPWVYILILVNLLIMLIVAACVSKKATVRIPICSLHRAQQKKGYYMSWLFCLGGFAMIVFSIGLSLGWLGLLGVLSLFLGIVVGMTKGRLIYATKIDADYVWIKGVCPEYLEALSEAPNKVG